MATSAFVISKVASAIQTQGFGIKIEYVDTGRKIPTFGVWTEDKSESKDDTNTLITKNVRKLMISYIQSPPQVGDFVIHDKATYSIDVVEAYWMGNDIVAIQLEVS